MTTLNAPSATVLASDLRGLMRRAWRRLLMVGFLHRFGLTLTAAFSALFVALLVTRLTPVTLPWGILLPATFAAAALVAFIWALLRMPRGVALADEVDRRTGLRECLSTAYLISGSADGWSGAVVDSAVDRARRVVLRDAIPMNLTGLSGRGPLVAAIAFAVLFFLPFRTDLTGMLAAKEKEEEEQKQVEDVKFEIKSQEKKLEEVLSKAGVDIKDDAEDEAPEGDDQANEPKKADDLRREAIRKLTKITDDLEAVRQGEQAKTLDAIEKQMNRLKAPPPGPLQQFQRELARGNFGEAKQQLAQLTEQIKSGELSPEQKEQAAQQLSELSEQLQQLSEQREAMENALQQAGMSKEQAQQAARDPNALDQMLQQMPGIPAPQQAALRQQAQAQQNASQAMQSMAQASQQMAQAGQNPGSGQGEQMSQAASQMSDSLSAAEMMASEQAAAQAAMQMAQAQMQSLGESMCEGGACAGTGSGANKPGGTGQFATGNSAKTGSGSGGAGRGNGASPDALPADFALKREKANVNTKGGPIIGSTVVFGDQVRGESRATFATVVDAASTEAAEAMETMTVPREYHDAVRAYFGRLEKAVRESKEAKPESGT